jgi:ubiquinol-cytochrome c reductase cytochrome b subunit
VPLILLGFVAAHICALHTVGSNNPEGIEISNSLDKDGVPLDGIPFHPFFTLKDYAGLLVFLVFFFMVVFYAPTLGGYFLEAENFKRANPLVTPNRIMPSWYLSPFYAILRAVPHKGLGAVAMVSAIFILFFLPWLDKSKVKSIRYKGVLSKIALATLVISFIALGVLGSMPTNDYYISWARFFSISYFAVFLLMPFYTSFEKAKRVPKRINI